MSQTVAVVEFPPEELARIASLRYILDEEPGFTRQMNGKGFVYLNGNGKRLRDKRHIARIETLAIPPAWNEVWICRHPDGHLQATGFDDRGRKQYRYHEHWREISNAAKFWRLKAVPKLLAELRRKVRRDMRGRGGLRGALRAPVFAGMLAESVALALIFGAAVAMVTTALLHPTLALVQGTPASPVAGFSWLERLMLSVGAGLYEELLFRVVLVSGLMLLARRVAGLSRRAAGAVAVVGGAVLFSAAHYVGAFGDPLSLQ